MGESILWGVIFLIIGMFVYWFYRSAQAANDPDIQNASNLRMSVKRYKNYKFLYDMLWAQMKKYGANSKEADDFFREFIFPNIDNLNEWRKYQDYRGKLQQEELKSKIIGK